MKQKYSRQKAGALLAAFMIVAGSTGCVANKRSRVAAYQAGFESYVDQGLEAVGLKEKPEPTLWDKLWDTIVPEK